MIQVGQVLDKYELLERVGQGGMAVVYRGIDRSLKRTVAIKILHKHLADYQEARDRFEREAQAVAKLRHENILEIYDYAAKTDAEAYIVTEFIDGQTLKQFITDRPIKFPEIGGMVMLQVCRALAHAHAGKILHRDVKPENIMIRSDGVVKLMDFGISHMVDLERLTVTGQLLGSPAYMAPEHVEGRPIDFRTDVFAVGIVLYQLAVGRLPFEGKNPHEVLKRIAECKFVDPRQANPRIGNRLGRIILKAMALDPGQRYAAIGEMVLALEAYLEESGLQPDKIPSELARYFKSPVPYEQALEKRLVDALTRRGEQLLDVEDDRSAALDVFDRVLTLEPSNPRVLKILDGINRRKKIRTAVSLVVAAGFVGGVSIMTHRMLEPPDEDAPPDPTAQGPDTPPEHQFGFGHEPDAPLAVAVAADAQVTDAVLLVQLDASVADAQGADGPTVIASQPISVSVNPFQGTVLAFGTEPAAELTSDAPTVRAFAHDVVVHVRNKCCQEEDRLLHPGDTATIDLQFLPARVVPLCDVPGTSVRIDDTAIANIGVKFTVPFDKNTTESTHTFIVTFVGDGVDTTPIKKTVHANETAEVKCVAR